MTKRPIPKPDLSHHDISLDDIEVLVDMGLNQQQALETLVVFPDIEEARDVVAAYKHPPIGLGQTFGDYDHYLTRVISALESPEEPTLYEDEVAERSTMVSKRELHQEGYRDRPWDSEHFYEHLASRLGE